MTEPPQLEGDVAAGGGELTDAGGDGDRRRLRRVQQRLHHMAEQQRVVVAGGGGADRELARGRIPRRQRPLQCGGGERVQQGGATPHHPLPVFWFVVGGGGWVERVQRDLPAGGETHDGAITRTGERAVLPFGVDDPAWRPNTNCRYR